MHSFHIDDDDIIPYWLNLLDHFYRELTKFGIALSEEICPDGFVPPTLIFHRDGKPSAYANEQFEVKISAGLIFQLHAFYNVMLSEPQVFPDVGDTSRTSFIIRDHDDPKPSMEWINVDLYKKYTYVHAFSPCEERQELAEYLTLISLLFVYTHEYFHHVNGHISLRKSPKKTEVSRLDIRTMEWDSDCCSIFYVWKAMFAGNFPSDVIRSSSNSFTVLQTAIMISMLLQSKEIDMDLDEFLSSPRSHPTFFCRLNTFLMIAEQKTTYPPVEEFRRRASDIMVHALESYRRSQHVLVRPVNGESFDPIKSSIAAQTLAKDFSDNWKSSLKARLEPFKMCLKLPD